MWRLFAIGFACGALGVTAAWGWKAEAGTWVARATPVAAAYAVILATLLWLVARAPRQDARVEVAAADERAPAAVSRIRLAKSWLLAAVAVVLPVVFIAVDDLTRQTASGLCVALFAAYLALSWMSGRGASPAA